MATNGQFYWPSVGNFVAAYGQFFMAADTLFDIYYFAGRFVVSGNDSSTGRILSAHLAGNQPLNWPENPAQTAYK